ncbi:MAG: GGDEF domain-containing protein [Johnsonella sp.]|nr:GGDEF domain-containing protein [Johnsonella sp.]
MQREPLFLENEKWKYSELANFTNESDEVIYRLLSMIGEVFGCSSSYVFEVNSAGELVNTYRWSGKRADFGEGRESATDLSSVFEICKKLCKSGDSLIREELGEDKEGRGRLLRYREEKEGSSYLIRAIYRNEVLLGFIAAGDPPERMLEPLQRFMEAFSDLISLVKEYRNSMSNLEFMSYCDQMTGAFNRNAFESDELIFGDTKSFGVVFCDVSDLKNVNDQQGHDRGDQIIRRSYYFLRRIFYNEHIYRIGGDEFIVICRNMKKSIFEAKLSELRDMIRRSPHHLAIGASWAKGEKIDLSRQKNEAEEAMYEEKKKYYLSEMKGKKRKRNQAWRNS